MFLDFLRKHTALLSGAILSAALIALFLYFRWKHYPFLDLDVKWLIVAGVPLLLSLFLGGYIKTFKGLGVELEANLKKELPLSGLIEKVPEIETIRSIKKGILADVDANNPKNDKYTLLQFSYLLENDPEKYFEYTITEYLNRLRNLKFIEIVNNGKFNYIIPLSVFKDDNGNKSDKIKLLTDTLNNDEEINKAFPSAIADYVSENDTIIDAYRKLLRSYRDIPDDYPIKLNYFLPVLDKGKHTVGVIYKQKLEARISEEVVKNLD